MERWRRRIDRVLIAVGIATVIVVVWWNFLRVDSTSYPRP
jgi:hypothetical protein